jgi:hypothetical protein
MDLWQILRYAHIAAGVLSFIVAPVALIAAKGGRTHKRWGMVYFVGMTFATLSATLLAVISGNTFLAFVGLFSFYLGFSGYRAIGKRRGGVRWFDWLIGSIVALAMLGMFAFGTYKVLGGQNMFIPLIVFGVLGSTVVGRDLKHMLYPPLAKQAWFFGHMIGMVASAIAAMSAFSVTNLQSLPPVVRILWPATVAVPLLLLWIRSYKRKFAANKPVPHTSEAPTSTTSPAR